jgi:hypothetical protein
MLKSGSFSVLNECFKIFSLLFILLYCNVLHSAVLYFTGPQTFPQGPQKFHNFAVALS